MSNEPAERCSRLLVGQGADTYDPVCWRPKDHDDACLPIEEWTFHLETQLAGAVKALELIEQRASRPNEHEGEAEGQ